MNIARHAAWTIIALSGMAGCQRSSEPTNDVSGGMPSHEPPRARPAAAPGEPGTAPPPASAAVAQAPALKEGDVAPDFTAVGDDGKTYSLSALKGKYVVLYFYPKDDTPGCTIEAKGFRDDSDKLTQKGAVVLGVSLDDAASHKAFREKYQLNFPLITGGAAVATLYGVPVSAGHTPRETFVIDKEGRILKFFPKVNPQGHSAEILALLH